MNKLFTKIATAIAGFAMVAGVGVGIGTNLNKKANPIEASTSDQYKLVKAISSLNSGDEILLGYTNGNNVHKANGQLNANTGSYLRAIDVSISNEILTYTDSAVKPLVLGKTDTHWTFTYDTTTVATTSAKNMCISTTNNSVSTWNISISAAGVATITSTTSSYGTIKYNSSAPRFLNYASGQQAIGIYKKVAKFTVSFNMQGHGSAPSNQTISEGGKITRPDDPTADGYTFGGWYKEAGCVNAWNFNSDTVSAPTILYAKWTAQNSHRATFHLNYDGAPDASYVEVSDGGVVTRPAEDPTRPSDEDYNYSFVDWYTSANADPDNDNPFDFENTPINEDLVLYAIWNATEKPAKQKIKERVETQSSLSYTYNKNENTHSDELNRTFTGIANGANYNAWSNKTGTSGAVYAGQSGGGNDSIQLRSNNSNSGIVTTTNASKRYIKRIIVTFNSNTDDRTIEVYGKNTAYSQATDLYNSQNKGTSLGTISYDKTNHPDVVEVSLQIEDGAYRYVGIRSSNNAIYIDSVVFEWAEITYEYNSTIRFSGFVGKNLWNELDTNEHIIKGYGVLFATKDRLLEIDPNREKTLREAYDLLAEPENETEFKDYNSDDIVPAKTVPTLFRAEDYPDALTEDTYIWNLCIRVANADLTKEFVASAYIEIDDGNGGEEKVHMQEITVSAKSLAASMLPSAGNDAYEGSLKNLAELA